MKPISFLLCLLACITTHAQDSTKILPARYTALKLTITPVPDFSNVLLMPGIEKRAGRKAIQLHLGMAIPRTYTLRDTVNTHTPVTGNTYAYTGRLEVRWYTSPVRNYYTNKYVGVELSYTGYASASRGSYTDSLLGNRGYHDEFLLIKNNFGAALTFGIQHRIWQHAIVSFNFFAGIKVRSITAPYKYRDTDEIDNRHALFMNYTEKVGTTIAPVLGASVSLGYAFYKPQ